MFLSSGVPGRPSPQLLSAWRDATGQESRRAESEQRYLAKITTETRRLFSLFSHLTFTRIRQRCQRSSPIKWEISVCEKPELLSRCYSFLLGIRRIIHVLYIQCISRNALRIAISLSYFANDYFRPFIRISLDTLILRL